MEQPFVIYLQYALPHLRKTKGNIIQDSSLVAEIGQSGAVPYVATKVSFIYSDASSPLNCLIKLNS